MRNKKYNPSRVAQLRTAQLLDTWRVGFMAGDEHCFLLRADGVTRAQLTPEIAAIITGHRHEWRVYMLALCVDDFGAKYTKGAELVVSGSVLHSDLLDTLNEAHAGLCAECNRKHLVRPAWVAYGGRGEPNWNEAVLAEVFDKRGGFERC